MVQSPKIKSNLLSFCVLAVFAIAALGSEVAQFHDGSFNRYTSVENSSDKRNYLLENDGTKIYGNKIVWNSSLLGKDEIRIDDQKFKMKDVKSYYQDGTF